ncbi:glycosyltransferase family 2 protein [Cyanobium sp. FGCU-52]|nr:glycosyltransferase family 2 protein [Cyanobium sp. FGCU52]
MLSSQVPCIAFIIPSYNEAGAIGPTIDEAHLHVPGCMVFVCDNNSSDGTAREAQRAGAVVLHEPVQGKGHAVRRLLRDVEADIYVMVDGDNTYDLSGIATAIDRFRRQGFDLLTGNRLASSASHMRRGHGTGNRIFSSLLKAITGVGTADVLSGLRILSRRLVRSFPAVSSEFEIETELSIFASRMRLPAADFPTHVRRRVGSESKLNTLRDGFKISAFILRLLHREFPLRLYGPLGLLILIVSLFLFAGIYADYLATGLVPRMPTLVFSLFGIAGSMALFGLGLILKEISNLKYENRYFSYLANR